MEDLGGAQEFRHRQYPHIAQATVGAVIPSKIRTSVADLSRYVARPGGNAQLDGWTAGAVKMTYWASPARGSACQPGDQNRLPEARSISPIVVVGSGTLAIRCAQLAIEMGHVIGAALCADRVFRDWAVRSNIPSVESVEELSSFLKAEPMDWIFSIANPFILPPDVFGRVHRGAFNYHDGPLPRYAGTHATSWALLAQETEYAITWHRIDDGVDTVTSWFSAKC
ncbi:formyltransferase family protein [Bradyrhizobium sp. USDA 10063]